MPLQFHDFLFHVEIDAIEWHDFQRETQFHGVVVAWIEFSLIFVLIEATLLRPAYVSTGGELMNSSSHVPTGEQQVVCFYVITWSGVWTLFLCLLVGLTIEPWR